MRPAMWTQWGGIAFMLGVLVFLLSRARHLVDPNDTMLDVLVTVGFLGWLVGVAALWARYNERAGAFGRTALLVIIGSVGMLAVGHVGVFIFKVEEFFVFIGLGTLVLIVGTLLFGIATLQREMLPRWRTAPLIAGLLGVVWMLIAFISAEAFLVGRTFFGLGWLIIAYILSTDSAVEGAVPKEGNARQRNGVPIR